MNYEFFDCDIYRGTAKVRLLGSDTAPMADICDEFIDLLLRLQEDRSARVVLIEDAGQSFDLTPDLYRVAQGKCDGEGFESLTPDLDIARQIVTFIQEYPKPVVAAASGPVRESGFGFFLAADVRLASTTASFTPPDMRRGLLPDWGLSFTLTRHIGPGRTLELIWSHRTLSAREAGVIGLVDRVIAEETWEVELAEFVLNLCSIPQPAVRLTKLAAQQAPHLDMTSMLAYEYEAQEQCWISRETTEGMAAFLAGRDPEFTPQVQEDEE